MRLPTVGPLRNHKWTPYALALYLSSQAQPLGVGQVNTWDRRTILRPGTWKVRTEPSQRRPVQNHCLSLSDNVHPAPHLLISTSLMNVLATPFIPALRLQMTRPSVLLHPCSALHTVSLSI